MEIPVGKYVITSDKYNIIVNTKQKIKTGKDAGKEKLVPEAFVGSIEECMEYIVNQGIRESKATSFKELKEDVAKIRKLVESVLK